MLATHRELRRARSFISNQKNRLDFRGSTAKEEGNHKCVSYCLCTGRHPSRKIVNKYVKVLCLTGFFRFKPYCCL